MVYIPTDWKEDGTYYGAECFLNIERELVRLGEEGSGSSIFAMKQTENLGKALKKLKTNVSTVSQDRAEFCFMGDSIFYAFDFINADGKAVTEDCIPDNGAPLTGFKRRPITPYDTFNEAMNRAYGNTVKIKKKIYSGDCAWTAFYRWNASNSDFIIINFGINDAVGSHIDDGYHQDMISGYRGDPSLYAKALRRLIEREITNGTAVVLMSVTKHTVHRDGLDTDDRALLDVYEQVSVQVAKEYNIPIINGNDIVKDYDNTMFIDGIHYTDDGFATLGTRMSSYFIGQSPCVPMEIESGSYLGVVPQIDGVNIVLPTVLENTSYSPNFPISLGSDDLYAEINRHTGGIQASITGSGKVIWSFYSPIDNMVVIPSIYTATENLGCKIRLDFGTKQGKYNNYWNMVGTNIDRTAIIPTEVDIQNSDFVVQGTGKAYGLHMVTNLSPVLHIASKGWHSIEITPLYPKAVFSLDENKFPIQLLSIPDETFGDGMLAVFGLNFLSYLDYKSFLK